MKYTFKAVLAAIVLSAGLVSGPPAEAGKRLTLPDLDWTGAIVTCRTIQWVLENHMGYKV